MTPCRRGPNGVILIFFLMSACAPVEILGATSSPRSPTATLPSTVTTPLLSSLPTALTVSPGEAHDASLVFEQLYLVLETAQPGDLLIYEICLLTNRSQQTVLIADDSRPPSFLSPPSGAEMLALQPAGHGAPIQEVASGLALPPVEQPYSLLVLFRLPYAHQTTIEQWLPRPPATIAVLAPQELGVSGNDVREEGERPFGERRFTLYRLAPPAPGLPLRLTIRQQALQHDRQMEEALILLGGLGALGAVLSAIGLRLLQQQRQRVRAQALMDAILDLDERFEQGDVSLQAYEQQRAALKERLRKTLSR